MCSVPAKVVASHLVELKVERSVEVPEPKQHFRRDVGVGAALRFPQAAWAAAALRLLEAGKALSLIEVEVLVGDDALQAQEVLHSAHLSRRVGDQPFPTDKQEAREGEVLQPVLQVLGVDPDANSTPGGVYEPPA